MPETWLTADLHVGHVTAVRAKPAEGGEPGRPAFRPQFDGSVGEMNEHLVDRWNATVGPDDLVFVLGDFAMGTIADTLPIAGRLNGHKWLVPGNHDRCWTGLVTAADPERRARQQTKVDQWRTKYYAAGFEMVAAPILRRIPIGGGIEVDLCHFPYTGDHPGQPDRFVDQRPSDEGRWLLHGHLHNSLGRVRERMIDVGVDAWDFTPVHVDQLVEIIKSS